jgi:hypothetical protein
MKLVINHISLNRVPKVNELLGMLLYQYRGFPRCFQENVGIMLHKMAKARFFTNCVTMTSQYQLPCFRVCPISVQFPPPRSRGVLSMEMYVPL